MRKYSLLFLMALASAACVLQGCARTGSDVWEDTKSAGRHVGRGVRAFGGKHGDSRQIRSRNDFECIDDGYAANEAGFQDVEYMPDGAVHASDYVPLQDVPYSDVEMANMIAHQPRETPGEPGSSIPGIEHFRDPSTIPQMAGVFRTIYFDYDSCLIRGQESLQTVHAIADYLRRNPRVCVFIEGHTDERGPQAYNFALGSRRSNSVRNMLIGEGVNHDNLFTISYGKERPVVLERHEEGWAKNRRVEFKVYER